MIVVLKKNISGRQLEALRKKLNAKSVDGAPVLLREGEKILLSEKDVRLADEISGWPGVERVLTEQPPYSLASRASHPSDTVVPVGKVNIGGGRFVMIAGPCAVESEEQIRRIARKVADAGADILRAGAFKPRTSPYSFQGLGAEGLRMLVEAGRDCGLPVVSEITEISCLELFRDVDMIQVGARNMQNFELLKELGRCGKPILLKRSPASTLTELLLAAEYILSGGNGKVVLCERGIRTFETECRNTFDVTAIPLLKEMSHLPVLADPSHATGRAALVRPVALSAAVSGADGLMIEVHDAPEWAESDGAQALTPTEFGALKTAVGGVLPFAVDKEAEA
ncbi:MAG: 3-deoxy-7-phosphoheptulonate synthase [Eubacteriales bacterium]|nr:3-deoxy-7-phosphoheptulonate synthase [Eubacteriales bacterium]